MLLPGYLLFLQCDPLLLRTGLQPRRRKDLSQFVGTIVVPHLPVQFEEQEIIIDFFPNHLSEANAHGFPSNGATMALILPRGFVFQIRSVIAMFVKGGPGNVYLRLPTEPCVVNAGVLDHGVTIAI